jgi:dephospho-CoA kinase
MPAPLLIGLTGPIGCGKSTVARMLADVGAVVINADEVARQVTERGQPALAEIRSRFGDAILAAEGSLDRAALASIVFSDPGALADLEQIIHPRVREVVERRLAAAATEGAPLAVIEAIKLVEGGLADRCDEVWVVDCAPDVQRARLSQRRLAQADAEARVSAQGQDLASRLASALDGRVPYRRLATDGTLDETRAAVEEALADALLRLR